MLKPVELKLKDYKNSDKRILIPANAITLIKECNGYCLVFVKDLKLYAENYFNDQQYVNRPEYLDIEVLEVVDSYDSLKFLLNMGGITDE